MKLPSWQGDEPRALSVGPLLATGALADGAADYGPGGGGMMGGWAEPVVTVAPGC